MRIRKHNPTWGNQEFPLAEYWKLCPRARCVGRGMYLCECKEPSKCPGVIANERQAVM